MTVFSSGMGHDAVYEDNGRGVNTQISLYFVATGQVSHFYNNFHWQMSIVANYLIKLHQLAG